MINIDKFKLIAVDIYSKGDLKGYMQGRIKFYNSDTEHEFLYRIQDEENGKDFTLVSIDYGYENKLVDILWNHIEDYMKRLYEYRLFRKETDFTIQC